MPYTITITNDSEAALDFVKFARNLDFVEISPIKEVEKTLINEQEVLEEDEHGIPIKYRDEIMAISKSINRGIAKRWRAELYKDEDNYDSNFR
ncbi:hypothetical protein HMPREF9075_01089 [Capnocytophaga sp. oral taxon 332 str. F0381]|uniref:hypothetical protein n=1 Tax=Capnocytophaga sp. oral taxon 332 TaxID=712213 RepID=UPI0002A2A622|nr:hypothetical protein [Capnocytophaga sp. oral taxon 332]EKY10305.1 hypothetical protein HMPREF9075_01089 [Capnocytophaga sp. oral taxon 332 str. F0381]